MTHEVSEVGKRIQGIVVTFEERKAEILKLEGEIAKKTFEKEREIGILEEMLKKRKGALEQVRIQMKVELGKFDPHLLNGKEQVIT